MHAEPLAAATALIRTAPDREFWFVAILLATLAAVSLFFGIRALGRSRLLADLPTSKVRSAAQGYVELEGRATMMPGEPVVAPLSGLDCTWYSYTIEHLETDHQDGRSRTRWRTIDRGVSEAIFFVDDGSGRCIVDPDGAEVNPSVKVCWRGQAERPGFAPRDSGFWSKMLSSGPYRYTESRIHDGDPLYVVGQFSGLSEVAAASLNDEVRDLLAGWKRDQRALLRRFDGNGDGKIDLQEWELARQAAETEILDRRVNHPPQPEFNMIRRARGKPFLVSTVPQHRLIAGYRRRAAAGIVLFLGIGAALTWALNIRGHGEAQGSSARPSFSTSASE